MSRFTMLALLLLGLFFPRATWAETGEWIELDGPALVAGAGVGVERLGTDALTVAADGQDRPEPGARIGVAESATHSLSGPSQITAVHPRFEAPAGASLELELRGRRGGQWTEWRTSDALDALDGVTAVEVRATLQASPGGDRPVLRGVALRVERASVQAAQLVSGSSAPTVKLWATRIGLVGRATANGHVIAERDHFVALPSKRALNRNGARDYQVQISYRGRTTVLPVWDVGPWNIKDDYWNDDRETFDELPRWTSQAEAAFFLGHNSGRDGQGRYVTYPTSIDIADGAFLDDLGLSDSDWVDVTFLWVAAPSPPPRPTPRVTARPAPAGAAAASSSGAAATTGASSVGVGAPTPGPLRAAAYNAPVAAPRVYLPLITRQTDGFTTDLTIQNVSNTSTGGVVEVYDPGGGLAASLPFTLGPFASSTISAADVADLPNGFVGSGIVTASAPIGAVVTGDRPGADRYAYEGVTAGAPTIFAPVIVNQRDGWTTGIQVQNAGSLPTTVQVVYANGPGARWVDTADLAPLGSATFYQPAHPALPLGFVGSAVITSVQGQPLAAEVTQVRTDGAAMAYVALGTGAERLEAPLVFKRYNGWDSTVQLFNLGSTPAAAAITYRGAAQQVLDNALVATSGVAAVAQSAIGMLPDGFVGSASIQATPGSRLAGVVTETRAGSMAAMSYSAGGTPAPTLALPLAVRAADGWNTGIEVQNPGSALAPFTLTLYSDSGLLVQRIQDVIQPGATCNIYLAALDGVSDGFAGAALVQSLTGQPLFVIANAVAR